MPGHKVLIPLLLAMVIAASAAVYAWRATRAIDAGRALFAGERVLAGRIVGHDADLPLQASRCINCHGAPAASAQKGDTFAPRLSAGELQSPLARRGGPPSRYSAPALCTLLRTGVDPAHVMIPRTMPRYRASDDECAALWAYLMSA